MKLTTLLTLLLTLAVSAGTYSQNTKLDLSLEDVTIEQVLLEIENNSRFIFIYESGTIDKSVKRSISVKGQTIDAILSKLLEGTDVNYSIDDRQVSLYKKGSLPNTAYQGSSIQALQPVSVSGKVTDSSGSPLPGVTIVIKGTTQGTITDPDGNYSLRNVPDDATLVFSFVGMRTQEIEVDNQTTIDVTMEMDAIGIEEVIAVGYSTRKAGELTGSISSVSSEDLDDMAAIDVTDALKGTVSGVTITDSHTPGEGAVIRIRGLGTINNNDPLWVVDGVPGAHVNPDEIESISILKDASAQAIYGARAANGVVLVTTKTGRRNQKVQVNVNVRRGISQNVNSYDLLNTREYGELLWLEAKNQNGGTLPADFSHEQYGSGAQPRIPEYIWPAGADQANHDLYDNTLEGGTNIIMKANKEGTDWLGAVDRIADYHDYSVGINGGGESTTYAFQAGFLEEEGILKFTSYDRFNLFSNITTNPTEWLEIGQKIGVTYSKDSGNQSNNSEGSILGWVYRIQPIIPVYDVMGNYAGTRAPRLGNGSNPLWQLDKNKYDWTKRMLVTGNVHVKAKIFKGLTFRTLFGANYSAMESRNLGYIELARSQRGTVNSLDESDRFGLQWSWSNTLEYSNNFADIHDITLLLGTEAINNTARWRDAGRQEFFLLDPNYFQLDAGTSNQTNSGNTSEWALFSMFGRLNYQFDNKYLLEAVVRRDGSSRFGSENNYGVFPAFSAGWRISNENFMSSAKTWLDNMKIRAGYGETGNDRIGNYNSYTTYASVLGGNPWSSGANGTASYYPISGGNETDGAVGFKQLAIGNPSVKWETTKTTNVGLDMTIFKNIGISVDLWKRVTEDMLYPKQIPFVLGRAGVPSINVGEMENKGFDFELQYNGRALNNELTYNVSLNVSHFKNELIKLSGAEDEFIEGGGLRAYNYTRAEKGSEFPAFFGYEIEGIFQSDAEADAHPAVAEDPSYNREGVFKFKDVNKDGVINADDRTYIGSPHPDFTTGLVFQASFKGFGLYTNLYSNYGNEVVNGVKQMIDFNKFQGGRSHVRLYESYGSPYLDDNSKATMPMALVDDER